MYKECTVDVGTIEELYTFDHKLIPVYCVMISKSHDNELFAICKKTEQTYFAKMNNKKAKLYVKAAGTHLLSHGRPYKLDEYTYLVNEYGQERVKIANSDTGRVYIYLKEIDIQDLLRNYQIGQSEDVETLSISSVTGDLVILHNATNTAVIKACPAQLSSLINAESHVFEDRIDFEQLFIQCQVAAKLAGKPQGKIKHATNKYVLHVTLDSVNEPTLKILKYFRTIIFNHEGYQYRIGWCEKETMGKPIYLIKANIRVANEINTKYDISSFEVTNFEEAYEMYNDAAAMYLRGRIEEDDYNKLTHVIENWNRV